MKTTKFFILPLILLIFLTITTLSQEHYIDSKKDTSFSFTLTSKCTDISNYGANFEGISNSFVPDNRQILELRIVKNCGQTTILNVASLIDSIVITRTDTGDMTACECYQICTLTVGNVYDNVAFNMFDKNEYLVNPYYDAIVGNPLTTDLDVLYFKNMISIVGDIQQSLDIRLINLTGQEVLHKKINSQTVAIPSDLCGLYICVVKTYKKTISKKIYISPQ